MNAEVIAAAILLTVAALALLKRAELAEAGQGNATGLPPWLSLANMTEEVAAVMGLDRTADAGQASANLRAFLVMIQRAEGTHGKADPYRVLFGGRLFDGPMVDHPRIAQQFTDKAGRRLWTSAAGAYQFMAVSPLPNGSGRSTRVDTWDRLRAKLNLPDFGPQSQDRAAVELIDEAGALLDVYAGRFDDAVRKVRQVWASLPGAGHDQPERSMQWARAAYADAGGAFA